MSAPPSIAIEVAALASAVTAASPLETANQVLVVSLNAQTAVLSDDISAILHAPFNLLDGPDPTDFPGNFPNELLALSSQCDQQSSLADLDGLIGRVSFNLAQVVV